MTLPLPNPLKVQIVEEARKWIGTPYRHQGSLRGVGADCLGLLRGIWREIYGSEPEAPGPYSIDWAEKGGEDRFLEAAIKHFMATDKAPLPGHLILFRWNANALAKHAGVMAGADTFIHSYSGIGVVESPLVPAWRRKIAGVFEFPKLGAL